MVLIIVLYEFIQWAARAKPEHTSWSKTMRAQKIREHNLPWHTVPTYILSKSYVICTRGKCQLSFSFATPQHTKHNNTQHTTHNTQHTTHNTQHTTHVWSACVSKILTDIFFYVRDIPQSTRTISEYNLIKWCQWEHLLDRILKGLRVRGAGLKLFMVSTIWCVDCALGALCPLAIRGQSCAS
jgi:hypothetical protein